MEEIHRLPNPIAEQKLIQRLWDALQKETGVHIGSQAHSVGEWFWESPMQIGVDVVTSEVQFAMGLTDHFTDIQIKGILGHELAHLALKHGSYQEGTRSHHQDNELDADLWATRMGYGEGLLSALEVYHAEYGHGSTEHPADELRFAAIKEEMKKSLDVVAGMQ